MEEHVENNTEEETKNEENKFKQYFVISIAIFLIVLLIVYFTSFRINDVIVSKVEGKKVYNNTLDAGLYKIIFANGTLDNLTSAYYNRYGKEFKACLFGKVNNGTYTITKIFYPKIYSQKFNEVVSAACPGDTFISLHTHPDNRCIASKVDINNLEKAKDANENRLMMIMCNKNLFNVYF